MTDILEISKAQARVLRSIAFYEDKSKKKGSTQYTSSQKVPNKIHVSGSTFNDNIKKLHGNVMVIGIKGEGKAKPFTITDIGQIAWLRYFSIKENIDFIHKMFPNIMDLELEGIINDVRNQDIKFIKNNLTGLILKEALDSLHIKHTKNNNPFFKIMLEESIELSSYNDLVKTAYKRYYNIIHPAVNNVHLKTMSKIMKGFCDNYDELKINIIDRITFLFYYILIQAFSNPAYMNKIISKEISSQSKIHGEQEYLEVLDKQIRLSTDIVKKKKKIIRIITGNSKVSKIIQSNLKQLSEYENTELQQISNLFLKG